MLFSGIRQGLPLCPYLILFYIDDVFEYFNMIFLVGQSNVFKKLHTLSHADDVSLIAMKRDLTMQKLKRMLEYRKLNSMIIEAS